MLDAIMTQLSDVKAFLITARTGSFAAAGRELGLGPAVLTKRVDRLEEEIGVRLFSRTTRRLTLTREGEQMRLRMQPLLSEFEAALRETAPDSSALRGTLRVKTPTTVGGMVGATLARFGVEHPCVRLELVLLDRAINPLEEGLDIALGALPMSFSSVTDVPLCPYDRVLVAAPAYLAGHPAPQHPSEMVQHDSLVFLPNGLTWSFQSAQGSIAAEVRPRFSANDSSVLLAAALEGLGIATLPWFLARQAVRDGRLVPLLQEFPLTQIWFKAMVPTAKLHQPEVVALLDYLAREFGPVPPWDR